MLQEQPEPGHIFGATVARYFVRGVVNFQAFSTLRVLGLSLIGDRTLSAGKFTFPYHRFTTSKCGRCSAERRAPWWPVYILGFLLGGFCFGTDLTWRKPHTQIPLLV